MATAQTAQPALTSVVPETKTADGKEAKANGHTGTATGPGGKAHVVNRPTFLKSKDGRFRFLIMDAPTEQNLAQYLEVLKKKHVKALVRACEPTYSTRPLVEAGFKVVELPFTDGDPPPAEIVSKWLSLVNETFSKGDDAAIAVHCVAGLGRAPVLVAIALIESGMEPLDAIAFIRKKRKGAINARQIKFIEGYRPSAKGCCVIL